MQPGQISTLILPGDTAWNEGNKIELVDLNFESNLVSSKLIDDAILELEDAIIL